MESFNALVSTTKVLIPTPNQVFSALFHDLLDAIEFATAKTAAALQSHRIEPELGNVIFTLNVDMFWFVAITGVEVEPIRSNSQDSWHRASTIVLK